MIRKAVTGIMLTLLFIGMLTLAFSIQLAKAESELQIIIGTTDSVEGTLDPAQAYDYFGWCILQQIAGTLVSVKPGSTTGAEFVPELAESWNVSDDSTIWNFTLRQGITFPDGTEFNATHVKYSFDRAITLIPSIPEGAPAGLGYDLIINRIEVLSTYKVRFYLNFPFSPFLGILACRASAIVDPKYAPIAQVNYTAGDPRASTSVAFIGPYNLSRWERLAGRDIEIKLDANPHYWNATSGYPKIKHIIFRFYSDSSSLRSAIDTGDVDMAFRYISPTDVLDLEDDPSVKVWWGTGSFIQYLCFQTKRAPFNDTRVRVAVAAALNRSSVCQRVFLGLSSPLYSIIPPGMLGHTEAFKKLGDANYTYTRSLLAQLGYNESNKLTFDLWCESSGHYPSSADQALLYKEALEDSGVISVTLNSASWANYKSNRDSEIMDAYVYGWHPDYVDPDNYAFLYWAAWLHTNYSNATQVALYHQARATTNQTLRAELYAQIDGMAVEQCSVVPLYVSGAWAVTKPTIGGIYLDITQDMRYWLLYIAEAEPRTWTVDDDGPADFARIQDAISAASSGDTIFVKAGIYCENVVVNKTLSLIGENREATIIDGNGSGDAVTVLSNGTSLSNFTLHAPSFMNHALRLENVSSTTIVNNTLTNSFSSILLEFSDFNIIRDNNIAPGNYYSIFHNSSHNTMTRNSIGGLRFSGSFNNTLAENAIEAFWLDFSPNTKLRDNNFSYFEVGGDMDLHFIHDIDSSNTLNEKPIYYWVNRENAEVPLDAGYVALVNCTRITVQDLNLTNNGQGILLAYTTNSTITENNITKNEDGISLCSSSDYNSVYGNNITSNYCGISLDSSSDNSIYHNNFVDNTQQIDSYGSTNLWDNGYPSGGNYWSDYIGSDFHQGSDQNISGSDGIGDSRHGVNSNPQTPSELVQFDNYPLMGNFLISTPLQDIMFKSSAIQQYPIFNSMAQQ